MNFMKMITEGKTNCKRLHLLTPIKLWILILGILAFTPDAAGQNASIFSLPKGVKKLDISIENHNNLIVVPVVINGLVEAKFILDSGASGNVILEKMIADILDIHYKDTVTVAGAGNRGTLQAYRADSVHLSMRGMETDPTDVLVLEQDYLALKEYLGLEVQGILGVSLFHDLVVEVNYDDYMLTLHDPAHFKPPQRYESIPVALKNQKPYISGRLKQYTSNWKEAEFLVDLGASHAVLLEINDKNQFTIPEEHLKTSLGRGLSGDIEGYVGRLEKCSIGDFLLEDVITSFTPEYSKIQMHGRVGTIGGEFLSRLNPIFHFQEEKLYFKKSDNYDEPFEYNMSGMDIIAFGDNYNRILVVNVLPNSPAAKAGVKTGDEILKINWIPVRFYSLSHINAILRSREGKKIRLKILRDDEKIKRKFRLERLI